MERLAIRAIHIVPTNDARHVAIRIASGFIPEALKMLGFTARIYAIVINVVTPGNYFCFYGSVVLFEFKYFF